MKKAIITFFLLIFLSGTVYAELKRKVDEFDGHITLSSTVAVTENATTYLAPMIVGLTKSTSASQFITIATLTNTMYPFYTGLSLELKVDETVYSASYLVQARVTTYSYSPYIAVYAAGYTLTDEIMAAITNATTVSFRAHMDSGTMVYDIPVYMLTEWKWVAAADPYADPATVAPWNPYVSWTNTGYTAHLKWTATPGATGFLFSFDPATAGVAFDGTFDYTLDFGAATEFSIALWPGACYYIGVQAYNGAGVSGHSNLDAVCFP